MLLAVSFVIPPQQCMFEGWVICRIWGSPSLTVPDFLEGKKTKEDPDFFCAFSVKS